MRIPLILFAMLSFLQHPFGINCPTKAADEPGKKDASLMCVSGARSPEELRKNVSNLASKCTDAELSRLLSAPDDATAMAAGWERVRRTVPESKHGDEVCPDLLAITRFLGLVEGRIHAPIPRAWEDALKSASGHDQSGLLFSPSYSAVEDPRNGKKWLPSSAGDHWLVRRGSESLILPISAGLGPVDHAAIERSADQTYAALYGADAGPYTVLAIGKDYAKSVWSSKVWADGRLKDHRGPPGWHAVTLHVSDESLVVFGASFGAMYIEVFDCKSGRNRCRFSTAYFNLAEPK
jgi:hypothetical protein